MTLSALGIFSAAGAGGGAPVSDFELIQTQILASPQSSITFDVSSFASTYRHLQIRFTARSNRAGSTSDLSFKLNGSTSGYYVHAMDTGGGTTVQSFAGPISYGYVTQWLPSSSATADSFLGGTIDILDAFSSTKNKTIRSLNGANYSFTHIGLISNGWFNTAPVSSIEIYDRLASLVAGSRVSIYGIKG